MAYLMPGGNRFASSTISRDTPWAVSSALEPGRWKMASATAGS